jgi:flagellar basal body-associated protein FliL
MLRRTRKKMKILWIIISVLAVIGMLGFTLAPMFQAF